MIVRQGNGKMKDQTWRENKCRNVRKKNTYIYGVTTNRITNNKVQ